jgi:ATP-dependent Clp protease protease subunit
MTKGVPMGTSGERTEWDDWLESHLFDRRVVVLRGRLDHSAATRAASKLMTLDATGDDRIELQLDSPGGPLEAAFAVVDVLDSVGVDVEVTCLGRVEGAAVLVAAVGRRRLALEHTRFKLADPEVEIEGRASHLGHLVKCHQSSIRRYHERLAEACRRPVVEIEAACAEGRFMDAAEAARWGIVDEVRSRRPGTVRSMPAEAASRDAHTNDVIGLRPPKSSPPGPPRRR